MGGLMASASAARAAAGSQTIMGGNDSAPAERTTYEDEPAPVRTETTEAQGTRESISTPGPFEAALARARSSKLPASEENVEGEPAAAERPTINNADLGQPRYPRLKSELPAYREQPNQGEKPKSPGYKVAQDQEQKTELPKYVSYKDLLTGRSQFPTQRDVLLSRAIDQSYGSPNAPSLLPGAGMRTMSIEDVKARWQDDLDRGRSGPDGPVAATDADTADVLHRAWLGSQRSAVATLGFNLVRTVLAPKEDGLAPVLGFYAPSQEGYRKAGEQPPDEVAKKQLNQQFDRLWFDSKFPATLVHEAIHRGLAILAANGKLPGVNLEKVEVNEHGVGITKGELLTRAIMLRFFGDVELSQEGVSESQLTEEQKRGNTGAAQILASRKMITQEEINNIEKAAGFLLYDYQRPPTPAGEMPRSPRGPR